MIDQSGSMAEPYAKSDDPMGHITKAEAVAEFCNSMLSELIARCRQGSVYKNYFDIAVIGYSGAGVYSALPQGGIMLSPSQLASTVRRHQESRERRKTVDGRSITLYCKRKIWVEPMAEGRTPTLKAFERLTEILYTWRSSQKSLTGFPPTIINITDGEATDCREEQLLLARDKIAALGTLDGEPLLINAHISSIANQPIIFPLSDEQVPPGAQLWHDMSSIMPMCYAADIASIKGEQFTGTDKVYRGVIYNAGVDALVQLLNIGSSTTSHIV